LQQKGTKATLALVEDALGEAQAAA